MIGLELDPKRLWKLRAAVFGGGALQMVIRGGLLVRLDVTWAALAGRGFDCMTLALSSTAIAMQAMNENGSDGDANGSQRLCGAAVPGYRGDPAGWR
ncbi:hypothetical protein ACLK17_00375 [Escherichia coli]